MSCVFFCAERLGLHVFTRHFDKSRRQIHKRASTLKESICRVVNSVRNNANLESRYTSGRVATPEVLGIFAGKRLLEFFPGAETEIGLLDDLQNLLCPWRKFTRMSITDSFVFRSL